MSLISDIVHQTICQLGGPHWQGCEPAWGFFTSDRFWGLTSSLFGTLVGGLVTYGVQKGLRRSEQRRALQERIVVFVLVASNIAADMKSVNLTIRQAEAVGKPGKEVWQSLRTIHHSPSIKPDIAHVQSLTSLKSKKLVEKAWYLVNEHSRIGDLIAKFNVVHDDYFDTWHNQIESNKVDQRMINMERQLASYLLYIDETSKLMIDEAEAVLRLVGEVSEKHFGSKEFLKLN